MNKKYGIIYIVTNLISRKQYVGQTIRTLYDRKYRHFNDALKHQSKNPFHRAIRKYRIKTFKWIPIEYSIEELDKMESFWIKELKTLSPNGYNLDSGGSKNKIVAECVKKRLSKNHANMEGENNSFYGKKHKPSSIKQMKKSANKRWSKPQEREKVRKRVNQEFKDPNRRKKCGHIWTEKEKQQNKKRQKEYHQKHPNKMKGKNNPMYGKVGKLNKLSKNYLLISPTGEQYNIIGLQDFCRKNGLEVSNMRKVLKGKRKHHKGWSGKFL
jgi:group I intron endonuclease